jgi:hypothetical protein
MQSGTTNNISSLKEGLNGDKLSAITEEYPYFAVAQFKLLSALKKNQNVKFEEQASKTAIFFNNVRWLNKQLHDDNETDSSVNLEEQQTKNLITTTPEAPESEAPEISHQLSEKFRKILDEKDTGEQADVFEPLHTVDYFASQGIKVNDEPLRTDKLSAQLKSFTEWLKTMKKIHADHIQEDEKTDKIIQHLAESSNAEANIVTEAMADVLVKQGKTEQAVEMYGKLSLNYPSKSAYFAAKIESLKSI